MVFDFLIVSVGKKDDSDKDSGIYGHSCNGGDGGDGGGDGDCGDGDVTYFT